MWAKSYDNDLMISGPRRPSLISCSRSHSLTFKLLYVTLTDFLTLPASFFVDFFSDGLWNLDFMCSLSDEQNFNPGKECVSISGVGSTQAMSRMFDRVVRVGLKHCTNFESIYG